MDSISATIHRVHSPQHGNYIWFGKTMQTESTSKDDMIKRFCSHWTYHKRETNWANDFFFSFSSLPLAFEHIHYSYWANDVQCIKIFLYQGFFCAVYAQSHIRTLLLLCADVKPKPLQNIFYLFLYKERNYEANCCIWRIFPSMLED
jgi:hypothetical protein